MVWGRKKSGGRKEPRFGLAGALADLRLDPKDRIPEATDEKEKKTASKRKLDRIEEEDDDPPPRERKPRAASKSRKRASRWRSRVSFPRLVYWGVVLSLWGVIAAVGLVVWVGAHLPAIQSLEIPKRPPTIEIVGTDGNMLVQRGEMVG